MKTKKQLTQTSFKRFD